MAVELEDIFQQINSKEANALIYSSLNSKFHKQGFKNDVQKDAVFTIVKRTRDVFVSMLSGNGRSLCYQLPAVIYSPKVTVVFCPIINRIKNHIEYLKRLNINSKTINASMSISQKRRIINDVRSSSSNVLLLFITPDQVTLNDIQEFLYHLIRERKLAFFVVDESYSECLWLYGPKKEYDALGTLRMSYLHIPWIVLTTVANFTVFDFIKVKLCLKTSSNGFSKFSIPCFRSNIYFDVIYDDVLGNSYEHLKMFIDECIKKYQGQGIIHCKSRGITEEISSILCQKGILVAPYHAGLEESRLHAVKDGFLNRNIQILTIAGYSRIAFEKSNVKFIIHWGLPPSILSYYREACQAGYDGEPAHCRIYLTKESTLYYNLKNQNVLDLALREAKNPQHFENALKSLRIFHHSRQMIFYCASNLCKHGILANYFGDMKPYCKNKCDCCLRKHTIQENIKGLNTQNIKWTKEQQHMDTENDLFNQKGIIPLGMPNWTNKLYAHVENFNENIEDILNAMSLSDTLEVQPFNDYGQSTSFLTNENEKVYKE